MKKEQLDFKVWVQISPAQDLPGQWVAECLDLGVVTQGNNLRHAYKMLVEAVTMVLADDLARGADPRDRDSAPERWAAFWRLMDRAQKRPPGDPLPADESRVEALVEQIVFTVKVTQKKRPAPLVPLALAVYSSTAEA